MVGGEKATQQGAKTQQGAGPRQRTEPGSKIQILNLRTDCEKISGLIVRNC